MISMSVGVGVGEDSFKAGVDACQDAIAGLPNKRASLLLVFASVSFDQDKLLEGINKTAEGATVVGCSTAGEISSDGLSMVKTVVILAIETDQMKFHGASGQHLIWKPKDAGAKVAGDIQYQSSGYIKAALLFLDVITGQGESVLEGVTDGFGQTFPLFGAAAGDDELFYQTHQYLGNTVHTGSVVGLGLSGEFTLGYGIAHGFLPVGTSRVVTRSEGVLLHELDGKPAIEMYREYFGDEHSNALREGGLTGIAVSYPLGVTIPGKQGRILRNPLFVNQKGSMTFTAAIQEGSEVRLMLSGKDEVIESAKQAAERALAMLNGKKPKGIIVIDSIARKKLLGRNADDEVRTIQQVVGRDIPIVGFYSYAQVGGITEASDLPFHNSAILVLALAE